MTEEVEQKTEQTWHIDRTVPIAWIGALILQAGVLVYAYAILNARVDENSRRIEKVETVMEASARADNMTDNRIVRIEEKLSNQTEILQEIKALLNRSAVPRQ